MEQPENNALANQVIVFTGSFKNFSREKAKELTEKLGGRVSSSISPKVSFIVAGENPGQKLRQAQKLSIKIISEDDFLKILGKI
jgi:DNA ligase (NAD+)